MTVKTQLGQRLDMSRWGREAVLAALGAALLVFLAIVGAGSALANGNETGISDIQLEEIGKILFKFVVLAVVFEAALSTIFNWRVFIKHFEGKGAKTVIAVGLAWLLFGAAGINIFQDLMQVLEPGTAELYAGAFTGSVASFITALLIAGGSDAIFRIYTTLKMRSPTERADKARAERGNGTIEITVDRAGKAVGPLKLSVDNATPVDMTTEHHMVFGQKAGPHHVVVTAKDAAGASLIASARVEVPDGGNAKASLSF